MTLKLAIVEKVRIVREKVAITLRLIKKKLYSVAETYQLPQATQCR